MIKLASYFKKITLAILVLTLGLVALPTSGAFAAGLQDQTTPPANQALSNVRLEQAWARAQMVYHRQGSLLSLADGFIARAQNLIDKANGKGWDTSAVQAALDAFKSVIPAAKAAHLPGEAIIDNHNGFTSDGKVTDRAAAIATTQSLFQVIKDTRTAMNGTGRALRDAIKAFREAHHPGQAPVTP